MKIIIIYILLLITFNGYGQNSKKNTQDTTQKNIQIEKLHETVKYRKDKTYYDITSYNGACNYKILINDLPVFSMYNNARGEISVPINGKILKSGKQSLKVILFPFYDENKELKKGLNPYAGLDITISKMKWDESERKFDYYPFFEYKTPREGTKKLQNNPSILLFKNNENLKAFEEEVSFNVKVPYELDGWSKSINLKKENTDELTKEVVDYYESLTKDFKNKNINNISEKYYNKEKEVAQSYFYTEKEVNTRWNVDILEKILDSTASVRKIEKYELKFFGNGKVVALMRYPGKSPLCVVTKKQDGKFKYSVYDIFLHRPKKGAPLEMIR
ncbi:hypothetical protein [Psychroserpens sp. NJDZ02]|uniref:hypothetical protein n=1 Tax=Psychroserpens sp. NJDZ02 TaxID=2570561 RepID=UPI0010A7708F|nr:hypothetical protein [Psychroserpens sp. NJDZ02]QCE42746.1 hypothetical protein E9099_15455 [Psychroserpens sp. NJDZ02]